jgi:hypothetical protein
MAAVLSQRCLNHPLREAVARCPECGQYYCRECVTEHDDRVVCSSCLRKLTVTVEKKRRNFAPVWRTTAAVTGLVVAWLFFFFVGRMLVNTPSKFHEGNLWMTELEDAMEGGK